MKIQSSKTFSRHDGMATILFIALLAIMLVLVAANLHALTRLHREVKLLEQQQIKRLDASQTNAVAAVDLSK
jgi:Tfp pilus assembly protein FimT